MNEPKFGEWISVKDRLPECDTEVLIALPDRGPTTAFLLIGRCGGQYWSYDYKPTHWMPLPPPPPKPDPFEEWFSERTKHLSVAAPYGEMKAAWNAAIEYAGRNKE